MFVFRFLFVLFFLFSNNALSMFFYTYIFYWNTIQYKYIISKFLFVFFYYYLITPSICSILIFVIETRFNMNTLYTNYFSYRPTMSCAREFRRYLFTLIILFLCLFLFCLDFVLFHEALLLLRCLIASLLNRLTWVQLYLKVPNHTYILKWYIIHSLIYFAEMYAKIVSRIWYFLTFLLFVFTEK